MSGLPRYSHLANSICSTTQDATHDKGPVKCRGLVISTLGKVQGNQVYNSPSVALMQYPLPDAKVLELVQNPHP